MKYTGFMHLYSYFLIWYIELLYDLKKTLEIVILTLLIAVILPTAFS